MAKTILKELIIILLLCIAIILVLSILFYDYNPINKVIPSKIAYSTPENIKNELEEEAIENTLGVEDRVYKIEGSDLNIYKKGNTYNPSKENPFATTSSGVDNITNTENTTNNTQKPNNSTTDKPHTGLK